jgi:hypothetical protein
VIPPRKLRKCPKKREGITRTDIQVEAPKIILSKHEFSLFLKNASKNSAPGAQDKLNKNACPKNISKSSNLPDPNYPE